jgi:hypothetical protein
LSTKDGQTVKTEAFYSVSTEEETQAVKKLVDEGKFKPIYTVTTSLPKAKNLAGVKEICPNEEEAASNFNRGAKQKANNRLKAKLLETSEAGEFTFDPSKLPGGVLDLTEEIASESKRKVLTEEEKLDKFLESFPEALRNTMKAAYLAARQQSAA